MLKKYYLQRSVLVDKYRRFEANNEHQREFILWSKVYNIHDHAHKFAVIDDAYNVPMVFVHCYNYTKDEAEKLSCYFDSFFYHKLYEFHMENKIVLMLINMDEMVAFINRTEECNTKQENNK